MENTAFSSLLIASAITTNGTMTKSSTPARGAHSAMCLSLPSSSCKGWLLAWRPGSRLVGFYREIEARNIPIPIMPVRLFAIVLALTLAACEKKEVASQVPPGPAGPPGQAGPPGGTVIRFVDGECRQTCTVACEANERILNTFAIGPGGTFILKRRTGQRSCPSDREPRPKSFSRVLRSEHSKLRLLSGAKRTTLESKPERGPRGDPLSRCPACRPACAGGHAVRTARAWRGIVAFTHPRTGGAHDSHHWTAGVAGRTRRCSGMAARGARGAASEVKGGRQ